MQRIRFDADFEFVMVQVVGEFCLEDIGLLMFGRKLTWFNFQV